jgi:hypothetical protein
MSERRPLCYYFYGGSTSTKRAAFMSTWGLLEVIPVSVVKIGATVWNTFLGFFGFNKSDR